MIKRFTIIAVLLIITGIIIILRIGFIIGDNEIAQVAVSRGRYTLSSVSSSGTVYDYNMKRLNNQAVRYDAVINPNDESAIRVLPYVKDFDVFYSGIQGNLPFLCEITTGEAENDDIIVFESYRNTENQLAPHIIGYTSDNKGVYGLEKSFDELLRSSETVNRARFSVDALGGVLGGLDSSIEYAPEEKAGGITTVDGDIQRIAETVMNNSPYNKGAVIIMDVKSGEIRACVSYPDFDPVNIGEYLDSSDGNFINRAFSAYSVGSVFKLCTAAAALEMGISPEFTHTCTGSVDINGQVFNCHRWGGHGEIDMYTAVAESCNTYFIELSEYIKRHNFIETAESLGFGEETKLCDGMVSADGYIQSPFEILVPAERANLSFGQGKLLATPLQICRMTACIANRGVISSPKLIIGTVDSNGKVSAYNNENEKKRVLSETTADTLRRFMVRTVNMPNSQALPARTGAAGKTSTAQTGVIGENGAENMNCWFTGYFPVTEPKYAVTVLIEDAYSGNTSAAPVFKSIADEIIKLQNERINAVNS